MCTLSLDPPLIYAPLYLSIYHILWEKSWFFIQFIHPQNILLLVDLHPSSSAGHWRLNRDWTFRMLIEALIIIKPPVQWVPDRFRMGIKSTLSLYLAQFSSYLSWRSLPVLSSNSAFPNTYMPYNIYIHQWNICGVVR